MWVALGAIGGCCGAAFAELTPTPSAAAPRAPAMVTPPASCLNFIVHRLSTSGMVEYPPPDSSTR